jgi:uncharacterized RDD family membrane protein YckC
MSDRPSDSSGLQPGDPLGGPPSGSDPQPEAPSRPSPGYVSPPPPGAGGPPAPAWAPGTLAGQYVLAGWWRRAGAFLLDGVIVSIGALVLLFAITAPFSIGFFAGDDFGFASLIVGLLFAIVCVSIVALLYAPVLMARTNGKTLGRMVCGTRVVRADGQPITFGFAMLREVAVKALLFGIAGAITAGLAQLADYLWPLWDEENRALHDFVVNTRTILD